jgi:hypothetical protein
MMERPDTRIEELVAPFAGHKRRLTTIRLTRYK